MKFGSRTVVKSHHEINRCYKTADIFQVNRRASVIGSHIFDGQVNITVTEEPALEKPVQILPGHTIQRIKHIPRQRMFPVPAIHKSMQSFFEFSITEQIF